jgi:peptide/nickel transport system ATP-binding protein
MSAPLLQARGLGRHHGHADQPWALRDVDLVLQPGESLGVVGESGAGKSTLARLLLGLDRPSAGELLWQGQVLPATAAGPLWQTLRREVQMVFQDPYSSLDPRWRVGRSVAEPLLALGLDAGQRQARVAEVLAAVGLEADAAQRFPHQFSGGQRQRLAIARALGTRPRLIVADEPLSALDVSVQAQILELLRGLQRQLGLGLLLISHDLAAVELLCPRMLVLRHGQVLEQGDTARVLRTPAQAYTRSLLEALA